LTGNISLWSDMRILAQLQTLDEALRAWKRYQEIPMEKFSQEKDLQYMVCHAMLLSIQSSIDIATSIAVKKTPKRPESYRETFSLLGKYHFIPENVAFELSKLAGFRNILVHEYTALDVDAVYHVLQNDWDFLETFRKIVKEFIEEESERPGTL